MKTLLLLTFCFFSLTVLFAQAPQGINYQAVVYGANSAPLSKHPISLRFSILDSISTGKVLYEETQSTTTDTIGLFSIVIGTGTVVAGNFLTINWGVNYKFLKTEIDTSVGMNFIVIGVTQFMSVPYALYANSTKPTYASIDYPDGLNDITTVLIPNGSYTVPSGKNLYISGSISAFIIYGDDSVYNGAFSENQTILLSSDTTVLEQGILVDKTVDWIMVDILTTPITVPTGKIFIVAYTSDNPNSFWTDSTSYVFPRIFVNNQEVSNEFNAGWVLLPGQTLSAKLNGLPGQWYVNGYFRNP